MESAEYLFLYGTLKREFRHPMHEAVRRHARFVEEGRVPGRLYEIDGYPGLVEEEGEVWGEVWRVEEAGSLFEALDRYEECSPEFPEPREYRRVVRTVRTASGRELPAWVYLYNRSVEGKKPVESGRYSLSEQ